MEEEGIRRPLMARIGYHGYQVALLANDLKEAKRYIKLAYDEYLLGTGPTSSDMYKMKR